MIVLRIKGKDYFMNDQEILVNIRAGKSDKSFSELYSYYPKVEGYILQNSGNEDEAKDIFQESIIIFYENACKPEFELTCSANTYVFAIAKRLWYSKLRKKGKEYKWETEDQIIDSGTPVEEYEEKESLFGYLDDVIRNLGEKCQAILKQYYYLKYSMQQIANSLNYSSVNAAKTQKYKCMERAKKMAAEQMKTIQP